MCHPLSFTIVLNLQVLESSTPGLCCYKDFQRCSLKVDDDFALCSSILCEQALKHSVWSIAGFSLIENIAAICVFNSFKSYQSKKRVIHTFYQFHLTLSDLGMSCYFLFLAIFNAVYEGDFVQVASVWKTGLPCKFLAFISLLSFQMTMYMTIILAAERLVALCLPTKANFNSLKLAKLMVLNGWILSVIIVTFTVVTAPTHQTKFNNALCIMLISIEQFDFKYALTVVLLNTAFSLCNIVMYSCIIYSLQHHQSSTKSAATAQGCSYPHHFLL